MWSGEATVVRFKSPPVWAVACIVSMVGMYERREFTMQDAMDSVGTALWRREFSDKLAAEDSAAEWETADDDS